MSSSENLLKATFNRLAARFNQKVIDGIASIAVIAKETPEKVQKEWELFQEEVINEADRIENESNDLATNEESKAKENDGEEPKQKIEHLRHLVQDLNHKFEQRSK